MHWTSTQFTLPEHGSTIDWKTPSGDIVYDGQYRNGLWFLPDGVYVYYTPSAWRYA